MAMATPIAHKGATAGAKVVGATMLDLLQNESLVAEAHAYFDEQTEDVQYKSFVGPDDDPAIEKNAETMALFKDRLEALYYDPARFDNYLDQLGIEYPQIEPTFIQRGR
jgi:aminobenzoyl-glutamate utilization protein B